jgi:superfamily I DNA/RNA helicase
MQLLTEPKRWELKLESFMKEKTAEFTYRGVKFCTIQDVEEFIDDEGDNALFKSLNLLKFLVPQHKSIAQFYSDLNKSFSPMGYDQSPEDYCKNGVILTTVHKAKGLEFNFPVLVNDDFHFDAIKSSVVNKDLRCDEGSLFYVAITRAKKHLYLSLKAKLCLIHLSELGQGKVKIPLMYGVDSCRKKYAR